MEPEGSLPYSQVPATCPYPEPTPSITRKYIVYIYSVTTNVINSQPRAYTVGGKWLNDRKYTSLFIVREVY
jgi:hypothetical protein